MGYKKGGKIDIVCIINEDGISSEYFPITKQKEAEAKAKKMTRYHNRKYIAIIKNVWKIDHPNLTGE